jgi:hypothetical protein
VSTYEANPASPAAGEPDEVLGEGDADAEGDGVAEEGDVEGDADVDVEGVGAVAVALADGAGLAVADGLGAAPPWHDAPLMVQSEGCPASPVDVVTKPTETNDGAGCGRGCLRTA